MKHQMLSLAVLSVLVLPTTARAQIVFQGLGDLTGGAFVSQAHGVSADGSVVVGRGRSNGDLAFRWTQSGGMVSLGDLITTPPYNSWGRDVSADGSVVVGESGAGQGFHWTASGGMISVGDLPGGLSGGSAYTVSGDGQVVGGYAYSSDGEEAFRWTSATGIVGLGDLAGGGFGSRIYGASSDGSTLVGYGASASGTEAMYWTQATGMVGIGDLTGGFFDSQARAVSSNGSVIAGYATSSGSGTQAFRWTQATGMVGLGFLSGGVSSDALDVSGDGNLVVGYAGVTSGTRGFIWRNGLGMINVQDYLLSAGGSLGSFSRLDRINAISEDGTTVVGYGTSTNGREAFRLYDPNRFGLGPVSSAPEPTTLVLGLLGGGIWVLRRKKA